MPATPPYPPDNDSGESDREFSIARSNALVPLLVLFAMTVFGVLAVIVRAKPVEPPEGTPALGPGQPLSCDLLSGPGAFVRSAGKPDRVGA